jgi:formamidopyrimidine-DNA glycosylase
MPEGHTIHRLADDHRRLLVGWQLKLSSPQGRFTDDAVQLDGRTLRSVEAVGKHRIYEFSGRDIVRMLHVHLGLYGKFRTTELRKRGDEPPPPRGAVRLRMIAPNVVIDLDGPTACELYTPAKRDALLARLGPDPLNADGDPKKAWHRIHESSRAIAALLLDQSIIAGIGNIYRAEVLLLLGVHPITPGDDITPSQFRRMWMLMKKLFAVGVKYNRLITTDPKEIGRPYEKMRLQDRFYVARRKTCRRCGTAIEQFVLGGRKTWACPHCQPRLTA